MTASISQPVPLSVRDPRAGVEQDQVTAAAGTVDVTLWHAGYGPISGVVPPGGPADLIPPGPSAALCEAAMGGVPALPSAGAAAHDDDEAERTADLPVGTLLIAGLPQDDATRLPGLSISDRGGVAVVSLCGELDISGASVLQAYLSDIRRQARARSVADLAGLAFIDSACLGVLVRHCKEIRRQGGSFALAGPQPGVRRILAVTGLLTWFEVHDTVEEAVGIGTQRSPTFFAGPARPPIMAAIVAALGDRGSGVRAASRSRT
jgi:anti-sigma B factor antagonist